MAVTMRTFPERARRKRRRKKTNKKAWSRGSPENPCRTNSTIVV
jgi:hypothetical protein